MGVIFKLEGKVLLVLTCVWDFTLNLPDLRKTSDELQLEELLIKMDSLYVRYTLYAKTHSGELIWEYKVLDILGSNFEVLWNSPHDEKDFEIKVAGVENIGWKDAAGGQVSIFSVVM